MENAMSAMSQPRLTRLDRILSDLRSAFARVSGIDIEELNVDATLLELGVDSLAMIQASQVIKSTLGVKVPFRLLIEDNPSIRSLAAYVDSELPPEGPPAQPVAEPSN